MWGTSLVRRVCVVLPVALGAAVLSLGPAVGTTEEVAEEAEATSAQSPDRAYGQLPLSFEPNLGQADPTAGFVARGAGFQLRLSPTEAALAVARPAGDGRAPLRLRLEGADPKASLTGEQRLPGKVNHLVGNDPTRWRTDIPTYGRVVSRGVYPGIDLAWYGRAGEAEYDFIVAPGADPGAIGVAVEGAEGLRLDEHGDLVMGVAGGELRQRAPVIYQQVGGARRPVAGRFVLDGNRFGFAVGAYDRHRPLVIDPVLSYSTYLGGTGSDRGFGVAVDGQGAAYVAGDTCSGDFPVANPLQGFAGDGGACPSDGGDAFVAKLNPAGSALVYATYLGGSGADGARGIAVDADGAAYVAGLTGSGDFPTTGRAFQRTNRGGADAFVAKLKPSGSALAYATYLGGSGVDIATGVDVDGAGRAYVAGTADSFDFPTTTGALSGSCCGAFVARLGAGGGGLGYATFLPGSGGGRGGGSHPQVAIAVDPAGAAHVAGATSSTAFPTTLGAFQPAKAGTGFDSDAFVAKLTPAGSALDYATYLGGASSGGGDDFGLAAHDTGLGVAVGPGGRIYVVGSTLAADFPTTRGAFQRTLGGCNEFACDGFVAVVDPAGAGQRDLAYATYLGGGSWDTATAVAVDTAGHALVTGYTNSTSFPTANPIQARCGCFTSVVLDAFVAELAPTGAGADDLVFSTFLGGTGDDQGYGVALGPDGDVYLTGITNSPGCRLRTCGATGYGGRPRPFPTTRGAFQPRLAGSPTDEANNANYDAFVSRIGR